MQQPLVVVVRHLQLNTRRNMSNKKKVQQQQILKHGHSFYRQTDTAPKYQAWTEYTQIREAMNKGMLYYMKNNKSQEINMGMTKTSQALQRLTETNPDACDGLKLLWQKAFAGLYNNHQMNDLINQANFDALKTKESEEDIDFVVESIRKATAIQ